MIPIKVDKDEIRQGIELGMYTKEYKHVNPYPDPQDPDDASVNEHTIYVYIDENYNVTGVKSFYGESPSLDDLEASQEGGEVRVPIVVKEVPAMAVQLGMLSQEEFKVLKICDGMNTVEQVAEIAQKPMDEIESMMENLREKGLVKVIKRT
ncbi:MAG: hypothetical protein GF317_08435 [Candidatus Lokiarchaeota archaeon]|nr:hypothetical protein [Candidatus Lokiarchaeota archaeon]MBD3199741.1 hypothetical protein [Candidatus Lokiarchaeota archaeon]